MFDIMNKVSSYMLNDRGAKQVENTMRRKFKCSLAIILVITTAIFIP